MSTSQNTLNKQRLIHEKPVFVDTGGLYAFCAYNGFNTRSLNVLKILHCLVTYLPLENNKKDIAATIWVGREKISEITGAPKPRVTEALKWLYENEYLVEVATSKLRYRAFTAKAIKLIEEYCANRPGTETVIDRYGNRNWPGTETVPNRDRGIGKEIDSREDQPNDTPEQPVRKPPPAKTTTTRLSLFEFYKDINKVTGHAPASEKNKAFQAMLDKYGREDFKWVMNKFLVNNAKFVWDGDTSEELHFDYTKIPNMYEGFLKSKKAGKG